MGRYNSNGKGKRYTKIRSKNKKEYNEKYKSLINNKDKKHYPERKDSKYYKDEDLSSKIKLKKDRLTIPFNYGIYLGGVTSKTVKRMSPLTKLNKARIDEDLNGILHLGNDSFQNEIYLQESFETLPKNSRKLSIESVFENSQNEDYGHILKKQKTTDTSQKIQELSPIRFSPEFSSTGIQNSEISPLRPKNLEKSIELISQKKSQDDISTIEAYKEYVDFVQQLTNVKKHNLKGDLLSNDELHSNKKTLRSLFIRSQNQKQEFIPLDTVVPKNVENSTYKNLMNSVFNMKRSPIKISPLNKFSNENIHINLSPKKNTSKPSTSFDLSPKKTILKIATSFDNNLNIQKEDVPPRKFFEIDQENKPRINLKPPNSENESKFVLDINNENNVFYIDSLKEKIKSNKISIREINTNNNHRYFNHQYCENEKNIEFKTKRKFSHDQPADYFHTDNIFGNDDYISFLPPHLEEDSSSQSCNKKTDLKLDFDNSKGTSRNSSLNIFKSNNHSFVNSEKSYIYSEKNPFIANSTCLTETLNLFDIEQKFQKDMINMFDSNSQYICTNKNNILYPRTNEYQNNPNSYSEKFKTISQNDLSFNGDISLLLNETTIDFEDFHQNINPFECNQITSSFNYYQKNSSETEKYTEDKSQANFQDIFLISPERKFYPHRFYPVN